LLARGSSLYGKAAGGVKPTAQVYRVTRLRMCGALPPHPYNFHGVHRGNFYRRKLISQLVVVYINVVEFGIRRLPNVFFVGITGFDVNIFL
jgi:hypothetical protein